MKDNQILKYIPTDKWSVPYWYRLPLRGQRIEVKDLSAKFIGRFDWRWYAPKMRYQILKYWRLG